MTKSELISLLAKKFPQLTYLDTSLAIQTILDNMTHALTNNCRIEIRGFGIFKVNVRSPRLARNPKTGEKVQIAKKRVAHFKPGLNLKKRVN